MTRKTKKNVENSVKKFIANANKKSGTGEILKKELLDVLLDGEDLWLDLASLVLGHARRDHGTGDATSPGRRRS